MTEQTDVPTLKVFMVAGEPSGDALGARLVTALNRLSTRPVEIRGVGGPLMVEAGLAAPIFPMEDLTAFGVAEVIPKIPMIMMRLGQTAQAALAYDPDVIVLIDAPGFNLRLARKLRRRRCPLIQYVAPTVWAWKPGRARDMARHFDEVLCLFQFEAPLFDIHGLTATDVGHSVVESGAARGDASAFRQWAGIAPQTPLLCVLPGSRKGELDRLLPIFGSAVDRLGAAFPGLTTVVPTLPAFRDRLEKETAGWSTPPIVLTSPEQKYNAFAAADGALAASGTVGLELAMAGTPHVIAYKVHPMTAWLARRILTLRYANLVNIVFDDEVVPEFIQEKCTVDTIVQGLERLMRDGPERDRQKQFLQEASVRLGYGAFPPSMRAAERILLRIGAPIHAPAGACATVMPADMNAAGPTA